MLPLLGGLISGGASLLGNIFSSDTSAQNTQANIAAQQQAQAQTEQFNASQAQLNRDFQASQVTQQEAFQQQNSNTAYQRASADMKAAGLNPMMMFGSGGPASVPSGGAASGSTASVGTPNMALSNRTSAMAGLGQAANQAVSTALNVKTFDKMTEEIANIRADEAKRAADTAYTSGPLTASTEAGTGLTRQKTATERADTMTAENRASLTGLALPGARVSAKQAEALEGMPQWLFDNVVRGGFIGKNVSDVLAPVTSTASKVLQAVPRRSTSETTNDLGHSTFTERWDNLWR